MKSDERAEIVSYRISRAHETMKEVQIQLRNKLWNTAINRLYYSCFYAVSALLLKYEIKSNTHSGTRQMLNLHFVKKGLIPVDLAKFYSRLFDMRQTGDYGDFIEHSQEDVERIIPMARELISSVEEIIKKK